MSPADRHRNKDAVSGESKMVQRTCRILFQRKEYLLSEQSLHRGQVSAIVIGLQAVLFLT